MFIKKRIPWNKGKKLSIDTRNKMSISRKGRISPMKGRKHSLETIEKMKNSALGKVVSLETKIKMRDAAKRRGFGKWMVGKKRSEETKRKISIGNKGKVHSEKYKKAVSERMKMCVGINSPSWKGENAKYGAVHMWVSSHKGKAKVCSICGKVGVGREIHWANIDHQYKRNLDDFIELCVKCHKKYDKENNFKK